MRHPVDDKARTSSVVALAFLIGSTAFAVDGSIPAIPEVADHFLSGIGTAQMTVGLFLLGYGLGQLPIGFLADYYGRRPTVLIGMTLFVVMGLLGALSESISTLLVSRFLQGLFGASGAVISRAIARDITDGPETLRLMSILTSALGTAMVTAPLLGGITLDLVGWRTTFGLSALLGAIGLGLTFVFLPETRKARPTTSPLATAVRSAMAFSESRQSMLAMALVGLSFCALITFVTTSSEFLIQERALSEIHYALFFSTMSLGYVGGGMASRAVAKKLDPGQIVFLIGSAFLSCAGMLVVYALLSLTSLWILLVLLALFFACIASMLAVATAIALAPLPQSAAMASALLGTFQIMCGSTCALALTFWEGDTEILIIGAYAIFSVAIFPLSVVMKNHMTSVSTQPGQ